MNASTCWPVVGQLPVATGARTAAEFPAGRVYRTTWSAVRCGERQKCLSFKLHDDKLGGAEVVVSDDRDIAEYTRQTLPRESMTELPYAFADAIEAILTDKTRSCDLLLDLLASIVHPDMVCNLFVMRVMNEQEKALAKRCIDYSLTVGLNVAESDAVYQFIRPRLAVRFCHAV